VWSNSCCGHPKLNETNADAAKRHLEDELNITNVEVFEIISDYRYKVEMNGIFENEICPILVCFTDQKPILNKTEVEATRWIAWNDFLKEVEDKNSNYSLWAKEEAMLLSQNEKFKKMFADFTNSKI
jgi:isopentenyl-diphosphate delta-isomerase